MPVLDINRLIDLPNSVWMSLDNSSEDFLQNQGGSLRLDGKCLTVHINIRIFFLEWKPALQVLKAKHGL